MTRKVLKEAVIRHLQQRNYTFLRVLGKGGFSDLIAVLTPDDREVAVKIVKRNKIWIMEDSYWPTLIHPNLLKVYNIMELEELDVKLYFMPIVPVTLYDIINDREFKKDPNGFIRVKKWLLQIISALEFLHKNGFCHTDLKANNILIDREDNALLADFSGLNFTKFPVKRFIAPYVYRAPEYFSPKGCANIRGELYDVWSFAILALNVLTGHYYDRKTSGINGNNVHWWSQLFPILNKALNESKFEKLLRKNFQKADLSHYDVSLSRHFIQFVMKIKPESRPSVRRIKQHLFLKIVSNLFKKNCYEILFKMTQSLNPFKKDQNNLDTNDQESVSLWETGTVSSLTGASQKDIPKRKNIGDNVRNWFLKKINKDIRYTRLE